MIAVNKRARKSFRLQRKRIKTIAQEPPRMKTLVTILGILLLSGCVVRGFSREETEQGTCGV